MGLLMDPDRCLTPDCGGVAGLLSGSNHPQIHKASPTGLVQCMATCPMTPRPFLLQSCMLFCGFFRAPKAQSAFGLIAGIQLMDSEGSDGYNVFASTGSSGSAFALNASAGR